MDLTIVLVAVGCFLLFLACFGWGQPLVPHSIQHWEHVVPGLDESADLFYARTYQSLKERLARAGLPDSVIGFGPGHLFGHGTVFGPRPQYLIVRYGDLVVYVYAFRLDASLFISYWAFSKSMLWAAHPLLRLLPARRPALQTLYRYDVTTMGLALIHGTIQEMLESYCEERGLKPLEEHERRPVLHSFYALYKPGYPAPPYDLPAVLPVGAGLPVSAGAPVPLTEPVAVAGPASRPVPAAAES